MVRRCEIKIVGVELIEMRNMQPMRTLRNNAAIADNAANAEQCGTTRNKERPVALAVKGELADR